MARFMLEGAEEYPATAVPVALTADARETLPPAIGGMGAIVCASVCGANAAVAAHSSANDSAHMERGFAVSRG